MATTKKKTTTFGWWGQRWLDHLAEAFIGPETEGQAKSALRADGEVKWRKGRVEAAVRVNYRQVEATLKLKPWTEREWRKVLGAIAARTDLSQRLLSGTFGLELEQALDEVGVSLFPPVEPESCRCTCNNWEGCRHRNFLVMRMAQMLDENPFIWFELMGRSRQLVLADLRARLADRQEPTADEADQQAIDPARFWDAAVDSAAIPVRPGSSAAADGLIRALGPLGVKVPVILPPSRQTQTPEAVLGHMVSQLARTSADLALGEAEPRYRGGELPGRPIGLAARLVPEVVEAVRVADAVMPLDELVERCPTAVALPFDHAMYVLVDACKRLPPDHFFFLNRYVGLGATLGQGATFRHVVTFDEWRLGELTDDGDWARLFALRGRSRPLFGSTFARLSPEVGDELWLTVNDAVPGGLMVALRRRTECDPAEMLRQDRTAADVLSRLMIDVDTVEVSEQDAMAALLCEGAYHDGLYPDQVWLLPLVGGMLSNDPAERSLSILQTGWRPGAPRFVYGNWPDRENHLRYFSKRMRDRGDSLQQVEAALVAVRWWCDIWRGPQDEPKATESLGSFLYFLWNLAPRRSMRHGVRPEEVPAALLDWFTYLAESRPAVGEAFAGHLKALSLADYYAHRMATAPESRAMASRVLEWEVEGYRWMGPAHFFAGGGYGW